MKEKILLIFIIAISLITITHITYASSGSGSGFIGEAFEATKNFLEEDTVTDSDGIISNVFNFLKNLIKAVNRVLLVALAGLSIISLSIIGIKYIMSGASPENKNQAKEELKTVIIGMAIGFGAYTIWTVGLSIINIILNAIKA